jgi:hypothetical protein
VCRIQNLDGSTDTTYHHSAQAAAQCYDEKLKLWLRAAPARYESKLELYHQAINNQVKDVKKPYFPQPRPFNFLENFAEFPQVDAEEGKNKPHKSALDAMGVAVYEDGEYKAMKYN